MATLPAYNFQRANNQPAGTNVAPYAGSVTTGQTVFTLPAIPQDATKVVVEINGVSYHNVSDFVISGNTVTWLNGFPISSADNVYIYY